MTTGLTRTAFVTHHRLMADHFRGLMQPKTHSRVLEDLGQVHGLLHDEGNARLMSGADTNRLALPYVFSQQLTIVRFGFNQLGREHAKTFARNRNDEKIMAKAQFTEWLDRHQALQRTTLDGGVLNVPNSVFEQYRKLYLRAAYEEYLAGLGVERESELKKYGLKPDVVRRFGITLKP